MIALWLQTRQARRMQEAESLVNRAFQLRHQTAASERHAHALSAEADDLEEAALRLREPEWTPPAPEPVDRFAQTPDWIRLAMTQVPA